MSTRNRPRSNLNYWKWLTHSLRRKNIYNQIAKMIHSKPTKIPITQVDIRGSEMNLGDGVELGVTVGVTVLVGVTDGVWLGYWMVILGKGIKVIVDVEVGVRVMVGVKVWVGVWVDVGRGVDDLKGIRVLVGVLVWVGFGFRVGVGVFVGDTWYWILLYTIGRYNLYSAWEILGWLLFPHSGGINKLAITTNRMDAVWIELFKVFSVSRRITMLSYNESWNKATIVHFPYNQLSIKKLVSLDLNTFKMV